MNTVENRTSDRASDEQLRDFELSQIREALSGLRFGAVNIVVQDGVVVQIDRTEKRRLIRRRDANEHGGGR